MDKIIEAAVKNARNYFERGFNCAEATLLGFTEALEIKTDLIPRIATGFGGGFGRQGELCGVLIAATMIIGIRCGRSSPNDNAARDRAYSLVRVFFREFKNTFGNYTCFGLTGLRLSESRDYKEWLASGKKRCTEMLEKTFVLLAEKLGDVG